MSIPRSVCLIRHGQTDWNLTRRYMGNSDRPLTAYGVQQAQALARHFAARRVDVVVHTGLSRSEATARAIAGQRAMPLVCDPDWRETNHGDWEGLTYREVMQRYPDNARARFADALNTAPQGGESLAAMAKGRFMPSHRKIVKIGLRNQEPRSRVQVISEFLRNAMSRLKMSNSINRS